MTCSPLLDMTDEEVCVLADPSQPGETREAALAEVERRKKAELSELDPSCFEGDVESGPFAPKTSIEWLLSATSSRLLRERVQKELYDRQERFPHAFNQPGKMVLMDICFRIAGDDPYHPSPSWVRQFAGELGLCERLDDRVEAAAYRYRMSSESYQRYLEKAYIGTEDRERILRALRSFKQRVGFSAHPTLGIEERDAFDRLIERFASE